MGIRVCKRYTDIYLLQRGIFNNYKRIDKVTFAGARARAKNARARECSRALAYTLIFINIQWRE